MRTPYYGRLSDAIMMTKLELLKRGKVVKTERWQGLQVEGTAKSEMFELMDYSFVARIPYTQAELEKHTHPNMPWAEDHFQERVSGIPMNPGTEYKNWPFFKRDESNDQFRDKEEGKHSHTYMERIWTPDLEGIRYKYGNLQDVVKLLYREPLTRQAFLPIWFPEDTGAVHGERVPCTLGYHFMIRDGQVHLQYPIRACDLYRHFQDDIYMACRLVQWIISRLQLMEREYDIPLTERRFTHLVPGKINMHIYSLHIFAVETGKLKKEVKKIVETIRRH